MDSAIKSPHPFPSYTTNELLVGLTRDDLSDATRAKMTAEIARRRALYREQSIAISPRAALTQAVNRAIAEGAPIYTEQKS